VNDLGRACLGLMFAPFTWRTAVSGLRAWRPSRSSRGDAAPMNHYANRTAAFRTKWVLFHPVRLGALALWSGSDGFPAYIAGMVLASTLGTDHVSCADSGRSPSAF